MIGIPPGHIGQKRQPVGTGATRLNRGRADFGHAVGAGVGSHSAGTQVNHATGRVDRPLISIPLVSGTRMLAVCTGQSLDTADGARSCQFGCQLGVVRLERCETTDVAHQVGCGQSVLTAPALAIPHQPFAPRRNVTPVVLIPVGKAQCQRVLAAPHRRVLVVTTAVRGFIAVVVGTDVRQMHCQVRPGGQHFLDIHALKHRIGAVPAIGLVLWRVQDDATGGLGFKNGLCRVFCIRPAGFVLVWPDDHGFASQR